MGERFDVVIVGGAIMGSAAAWFIASHPGFDGTVLVVERDPSYATAATSFTNSCIRQQFSNALNVEISRFGVDYLRSFRDRIGDPEAPGILLDDFGYLYLAATGAGAEVLRANAALQRRLGAGTEILGRADLAGRFPFLVTDDILLGSFGSRDEGYFDGQTMFQWWKRKARARGVEYRMGEVVAIDHAAGRVTGVTLKDGTGIAAGTVINAAGPRAGRVAALAGVALPVEPRRRYTYVFAAEVPPGRIPLVIDPSGVHMRSDGPNYMAGCGPIGPDDAMDPDDFAEEPGLWEDKLWPAIAARIPAFERVRVLNSWVGHYDYNTLDQNAVVGPVPGLENFVLMNGFSGHGLQQAPAMGRGVAELVVDGGYRTLDLAPLGFERVAAGRPFAERNVI